MSERNGILAGEDSSAGSESQSVSDVTESDASSLSLEMMSTDDPQSQRQRTECHSCSIPPASLVTLASVDDVASGMDRFEVGQADEGDVVDEDDHVRLHGEPRTRVEVDDEVVVARRRKSG